MTQFANRIALCLAALTTLVAIAATPAQATVMSKSATIAVSVTVLPHGGVGEAPHATTHVIAADQGGVAVDVTMISY